jgi:hypothetical protein
VAHVLARSQADTPAARDLRDAHRSAAGDPNTVTNRDRLIRIGEAMYGPRWKLQVSHDIGVDKRQILRWVADEYAVPDGVIADLERVARARIKSITAAIAAK